MPDEWTEVNLMPRNQDDRLKVLLEVIDPLVHDKLSARIDSWHYGQYDQPAPYHLRLRVLWREHEQSTEGRNIMSGFLEDKKNEGILSDWYEGNHGDRNRTYTGESPKFKEMWDLTYRFWESQSEFSLALLKRESDGSLSEDLTWHWESNVHLFSNRLLLGSMDEVYLGLQRALGYIDPQSPGGQAITGIQYSIGTSLVQTATGDKPLLTESIQERFKTDFGIP
jgi:Lantibiotic biosynthesis dehydratase C-term